MGEHSDVRRREQQEFWRNLNYENFKKFTPRHTPPVKAGEMSGIALSKGEVRHVL
jgi:hypothetical protein